MKNAEELRNYIVKNNIRLHVEIEDTGHSENKVLSSVLNILKQSSTFPISSICKESRGLVK